jgi:hypothetical protein
LEPGVFSNAENRGVDDVDDVDGKFELDFWYEETSIEGKV